MEALDHSYPWWEGVPPRGSGGFDLDRSLVGAGRGQCPGFLVRVQVRDWATID